MAAKILYNFATRSRPEKAIACLENITTLASHPNYQIVVTADIDDSTMFNEEIRNRVESFKNTKIFYGTSKGKIDAINKNIYLAEPDWEIICNHSDDMVFTTYGFDDIIRNEMPEDLDCFLHFPDGNVGNRLCTMSILGRVYFERFGYIYHGSYANVFCDNEEFDKAKILDKYKFVDNQIFSHLHPAFGKAESDAQYLKTEAPEGYAIDRNNYFARKAKNFDL